MRMHSKRHLEFQFKHTDAYAHTQQTNARNKKLRFNEIRWCYYLILPPEILIIFIKNIIDLSLFKWKTGIIVIDSDVFRRRGDRISISISLSVGSVRLGWAQFGLGWSGFVSLHLLSHQFVICEKTVIMASVYQCRIHIWMNFKWKLATAPCRIFI